MQPVVPEETTPELAWLDLVRRQVGSLRYGFVQIIVHDGHVIQIERTERVRLEHPARAATQVSETAARTGTTRA